MIAEYSHSTKLIDSLTPRKKSVLNHTVYVPDANSSGEFSDLLDTIRLSLEKMFFEKRLLFGSQDSAQSVSGDEEDIKIPLSPKINLLLEMMNVCMNKLDPSSPSEDSAGFNSTKASELTDTCPPNLSSRGSVPNIAGEDRSLFSNTFGRRKSNIHPIRERTGSLASVATISTLTSAATSSPRSSFYISSQSTRQPLLAEVMLNATHKGWLSKQYVPQSSFLLRKTWKRRYFILNGTYLYRFKTNLEIAQTSEIFRMTPTCSVCVTDDFPGKKFVLQITEQINNSILHLMAESSEDLSTWLSSLKEAVTRARFEQESLPPSPAVSQYDYPLESRRSSAQTLPISFLNPPEVDILAPTRLSRANSQPAVQTSPTQSTFTPNTNRAKHLSHQNSMPVTPTSTSTPITGRLVNLSRIRNPGSARLSSTNNSRRPSLAPLHEQENDDSDFLKEVLSPFNHRSSTFLGIFSQSPAHATKQ